MNDRQLTSRPPSATAHGYPRQGRDRELKRGLEGFWSGALGADDLLAVVDTVREQRLGTLIGSGLAEVPVGDFSLYDHVLDTTWMLGAIPERFVAAVPDVSTVDGRLRRYFAMARGTDTVEPLEMTKWFDTNYHYLVPELSARTRFGLDPATLLDEVEQARGAGATAVRPIVLGPVSFLLLAKSVDGPGFQPITLLDRVLPSYVDLLGRLADAGVEWVQFDEPVAVTDLSRGELNQLARAYRELSAVAVRPRLLVGTYFGHLGEAAGILAKSDIDGLAVDFTGSGEANLALLAGSPGLADKRLVAGLVDGRNVWRTDLERALATAAALLGLADRVDIAPSCSLLHVPHDVARERHLDPAVVNWLAFADQKLAEVVTLARGLAQGRDVIADELRVNAAWLANRRASQLVYNPEVRARLAFIADDDLARRSPYDRRQGAQQARLRLPVLPTTTIGSFPQTAELRRARAAARRGELPEVAYRAAMRAEIDSVIHLQEELGLDLLVHGEPERNDMVQYFAEQLGGYLTTEHGWVQSYGSRYVRPPILAGDITRPSAMTLEWATYAQTRTRKPVKGMLTGPVTMLAWSFVRDDQPLADTARQVALALRQEVLQLEESGLCVIQVDEPALRETLPLRRADRPEYLRWAVDAFRLATAGVADETQIHTHMCYAEFGDIIGAIAELDADVISLEAARSRMEVVGELAAVGYPRQVGPGVWDIHSPRVPSVEEIVGALRLAIEQLPASRIWVNPDCGLKTRGYAEVEPALRHLVEAARELRADPAVAGA